MKIIHTSDWHLGHTLYSHDRSAEQLAMLRSIQDIAVRERPDALVVSGDLFHTSQPSAAVQTMLSEALIRMHRSVPEMAIVVTAGNHDSPTRHEVFRTPWSELGVHVVGTIDKETPSSHIVELPGRGYIIAVPYASGRNLRDGFFAELAGLVAERNSAQLPVVMMVHATVVGCDAAGHEMATELTVGGVDAMSIEEFGNDFDYLALGHIHKPQTIRGTDGRARYSGTPLPVTFDEAYPHSVSVVEIARRGASPEIHTVEIPNPMPLITLPAEGYAEWGAVPDLIAALPDDLAGYLRLNVEVDDFLPTNARHRAEEMCEGKAVTFCLINAVRREARQASGTRLTVDELRRRRPIDIFRQYLADSGRDADPAFIEMFNQAVSEL